MVSLWTYTQEQDFNERREEGRSRRVSRFFVPSSFVREWLKITTGVHLSSDSINSLRMSVMVSKFDDLKGGGKDYYAHMRTRIY